MNSTWRGVGVIGVGVECGVARRPVTVAAVAKELNRLNQQGSCELATWPDYLVEANASPVSGCKNQLCFESTNKNTVDKPTRRQCHLRAKEDLRRIAEQHRAPYAVALSSEDSDQVLLRAATSWSPMYRTQILRREDDLAKHCSCRRIDGVTEEENSAIASRSFS